MAEQKLDDLAAKVSALQASVEKMLAGEMLPIAHAGMHTAPPSGSYHHQSDLYRLI